MIKLIPAGTYETAQGTVYVIHLENNYLSPYRRDYAKVLRGATVMIDGKKCVVAQIEVFASYEPDYKEAYIGLRVKEIKNEATGEGTGDRV